LIAGIFVASPSTLQVLTYVPANIMQPALTAAVHPSMRVFLLPVKELL